MAISSADIRRSFLEYFRDRGHTIVASAPLVPAGDPTLLFTNAGMVQFKGIFLGVEHPSYTRATTSQKCLRVSGKHNDLDNVGPSPRHHTFFEMLGNFSFGDYFKEEAIAYAYEYLTSVLKLDADRLSYTVYEDDDESYGLWQRTTGVGPERIHRLGAKSNFWSMGDTGPCGPNTEVMYDLGPEHCSCGDPTCSPALDNDCNRWLEIWNLVFMQYNMGADGSLSELPAKGVDTGLGLERVAAILQAGETNYDTDLFLPLMDKVQALLEHSDAQRAEHMVPYRVIADHTRAITFMVADGILPANEGRGYVLRLLLRRAARFGRMIGFADPFLSQVADVLIDSMGAHYTELPSRRDYILQVIHQEEERFQQTLSTGLTRLAELAGALKDEGATEVPGEEAFRLYDTYGFPIDLTVEVAQEAGLGVDMDGFRSAMQEQRQRARAAQTFAAGAPELERYRKLLDRLVRSGALPETGTERLHLDTTFVETQILAFVTEDQEVASVVEGDHVGVVLRQTPFYVESGGQVTDTGIVAVYASDDLDVEPIAAIEVDDVRAPVGGLPIHWGEVVRGRLEVGQPVWAMVDYERRMDLARNHTATHLLHSELRFTLGQHVQQAGSQVTAERLRFDFTHSGMLTQEELTQVEQLVNEAILADYPVDCEVKAYREAVDGGAMALFGEKYGDEVRVVSIGEGGNDFSKELCGGTHVERTSQISLFHIVSEGSVGAGVRRIEAVTGRAALNLVMERMRAVEGAATFLGTKPEEVDRRVLQLMERVQALEKETTALQRQASTARLAGALQSVVEVEGVKVLATQVEATDVDAMREMTDYLRDRLETGVVILGAVIDQKPAFVATVSKDLVERGLSASRLVKDVARVVGGGGGGRDTMAQAGGKDPSKVAEALASAAGLIESALQSGKA
mgnify:FL=1